MRKLLTRNSCLKTCILSLALFNINKGFGIELAIDHTNMPWSKVTMTSTNLNELNTHILTPLGYVYSQTQLKVMWSDPYGFLLAECTTPENPYGNDLVSNLPPTDPKRIAYMNIAVEHINKCDWVTFTYDGSYSGEISGVEITYRDRPNGPYSDGMMFGGFPWSAPKPPVACESYVSRHVSLRSVAAGEATEGEGVIRVTCDSNASLEISVNNQSPLETTEGSILEFNYGRTHVIEGIAPYEILIQANMVKSPSVAGAYEWAVPVKITYE
ncbi:hypothetical protein B9J87_07530 [Vibrio sp. V19_P1S1T109]|uniref:hypothetical protein n=1 Tax=Vibrio sp. V19_P1S1T109 TaxID=1938672 RepID=UPI000B8EBA9F|nr:hypothetical protein [Vibrio sp. V19_P1S1T109]OXX72818.1 hypothetical protein B9J87_07530 [Vibrio sp. V19_P1S1T109]